MAIVKNNPLLHGVSGKIGEMIIRQYNGKTVVSKRPEKSNVSTQSQREKRNRFSEASRYARTHMNNPELKAMYETGMTEKKRSPYLVATTDFLTPPTVHHVVMPKSPGRVGAKLQIKATDDFKVVSVKVSILDYDGKLVESGNAKPAPSSKTHWNYKLKITSALSSENVVIVEASDFAGNIARASWILVDHAKQKKILQS
ncbi:MAG: hypothetical protein ABIS36_07325 [Chryseolinea sp.]